MYGYDMSAKVPREIKAFLTMTFFVNNLISFTFRMELTTYSQGRVEKNSL